MSKAPVVVVRTGTANLASVVAAFKRIGWPVMLSDEQEVIAHAPLLVLPGVGTLEAAMSRIAKAGLVEILKARLAAERPTLAICLGMQLLCETSEESPGLSGLGIVPGVATRFPDPLRVPQLGWNQVIASSQASCLRDGYYYFANSYRLVDPPDGWHVAIADYGGPFVAALERGPVVACQFHPELSAKSGIELIERWLERSQSKGVRPC